MLRKNEHTKTSQFAQSKKNEESTYPASFVKFVIKLVSCRTECVSCDVGSKSMRNGKEREINVMIVSEIMGAVQPIHKGEKLND